MPHSKFFQHPFYGEREQLVYGVIGQELEKLEITLKQLHSPCVSRIMNSKLSSKDLTIQEVLNMEPKERQDIVAAIMYNDGFWRIETAYLMLCVGHLNLVYSNLRSCLECIVAANIAENIDDEAVNFLNGRKINPNKLAVFTNKDYNQQIKEMKKKLSEWGVHSQIVATRLAMLGPNTFDRMISELKNPRPQLIVVGFKEAALDCIKAIGSIFIVFMFLISRGRVIDKVH